MKSLILSILLVLLGSSQVFSNNYYDKHFTNERMRIDYYVYAQKDAIEVKIKDITKEPHWAGVRNENLQKSYGGNFKYRLIDIESDSIIFERGFSSMVEEWQSSDLKEEKRRFEMVAIMPFPKSDVSFEILQWDMHKGKYDFVYSSNIDVEDIKEALLESVNIDVASSTSVDVVILSEGYTKEQESIFISDCNRFTEYMFNVAPFDSLKADFTIRNVFAPSEDSGTSMLDGKTKLETNYGSSFYTFEEPRYLTTESMFSVHNAIAGIDYDYIIILVNTDVYGGAGFYNTYAITSAHNTASMEVFIHEFGHSFAGLADEYFYEHDDVLDGMYSILVEPWEANITSRVDFSSKWEDMMKDGIRGLGLYEGAGYLTKGMYRGEDNCMMRALSYPFCAVCRRQIINITQYNIGE